MKQKWETKNAPIPSKWIAQVSRDDNLGIAYISGLIAGSEENKTEMTAAQETKIILENLKRIVEDMGLSMDNIIKTNIFISDMKYFNEMDKVYREYFSHDNPPARQCVGAVIWGNYKLEISSVAILK